MKKKYLLFDADGTILDFDSTESIAFDITLEYLKIQRTKDVENSFNKINRLCWTDVENGTLTTKELETKRWRMFLEPYKMEYLDKECAKIFGDGLQNNGILLNGAKEMLLSLNTYKKAIITNGISRIQYGRLKGTGIYDLFDKIYISDEVGYPKPRKEFFSYILSDLKLSREDVIVIGDSPSSDIQGAVNSGLDSIFISFKGEKCLAATYNVTSYDELVSAIKAL